MKRGKSAPGDGGADPCTARGPLHGQEDRADGIFSAIGNSFTSVRNWFAAPQTAVALANLKSGVTAVLDQINAGASLAADVEAAIEAGTAARTTTGQIVAVSGFVLQSLQGVPQSTVTVQSISNGVAKVA